MLTGPPELSALILTTHPETARDAFGEFRAGLDHVSLAVPDDAALSSWQDRLQELTVPFDFRAASGATT